MAPGPAPRMAGQSAALEATAAAAAARSCAVEVYGLGYVGFPLAVRLAAGGFDVTGVDTSAGRLGRLEEGRLMESELRLAGEFEAARRAGRLSLAAAPPPSGRPRVGMVCVPTPPPSDGGRSDALVREAAKGFLARARAGDVLVIESSVGSGTTEGLRPLIAERGLEAGTDLGLCFCPERIDPQNRKWGLENIPRIIYCSDDASYAVCQQVYRPVNGAVLRRVASPRTAEVVKAYENAFRLVNISLVNELAALCGRLGVSVADVIAAARTKPFGFMPFYPGAGAGGHCIPKDPQFLVEAAEREGLGFTTVSNALEVNARVPGLVCDSISRLLEERGLPRSVLVCGLAYKADVEDMRDSPGFKVLAGLASRGVAAAAHDPYYDPALLPKYLGENRLPGLGFRHAPTLEDGELAGAGCLCLVQHHARYMFRVGEIYERGLVPLVYDCQSRLEARPGARAELASPGGGPQPF